MVWYLDCREHVLNGSSLDLKWPRLVKERMGKETYIYGFPIPGFGRFFL